MIHSCAAIFIVLIFSAIVGAFCWPYTINTWLVFYGKEPQFIWWQGALLGFVPWVGQAGIPIAVITWILMMFLI